MDDAKLLCARLLREGALERKEARALDFPEVRADVERRLADVGLTLATSIYSQHVALRLSPDVTAHQAFDSASNLGLKADACALLVILWARLVLQKRTAADSQQAPGQVALLPEDQANRVRDFTPSIRFETLVREFGPVLGARTHVQALVTQLRRMRFIAGRGEVIEAGPLLELGIDGEKMIAFIKRRVLAELLEKRTDAAQDVSSGVHDQILNVLRELGGTAAMGKLEERTGEKVSRLRGLVSELEERGLLYRTGTRNSTRYHLKTP